MRPNPIIQNVIAILVLATLGVSAQSGTRTIDEISLDYSRIHFGDRIEVDIVGSLQDDWSGSLSPEGFLSGYQLLDEPLYALCMTTDELSAALTERLSKLLKSPEVVVRITDKTNRPPAVLTGAVRSPRKFQIRRPARLQEILILAGGLGDKASGSVQIYRPGGLSCAGGDAVNRAAGRFIDVEIAKLLAGSPEANPEIGSGDLVTVLEASPIFIVGGVASPGQISTRGDMTLSRVIDSAGGLLSSAEPTRIRVFRRGTSDAPVEYNLLRIRAGSDPDPRIDAFDVIDVPQRGRPRSFTSPYLREVPHGTPSLELPVTIIDWTNK